MNFSSSIKNVFSLGVLQLFNYVLPLFTVPYLLVILGAKTNGELITSQTIVSYFALLIDYGFVLTASKKVAINNKREEIQRIFSSVFFSKVILCLFAIIILLIFSIFIENNKTIFICIIIGFFQVIGTLFNPVWLFQGTENANVLAKINIIVRSIFYVLIFIFVHSYRQLNIAVFLLSFPYFLIGIICFFKAKKFFNIKLVKVSKLEIIEELKEGFYGFWITLMNYTYTASGILFLGMFTSQQVVGVYGTVEKLIRAGIQVFNPVIHGLYPKVLNLIKENKLAQFKKMLFICFGISAILGILLCILSPLVSMIFFREISNSFSENILRLLSIWFILNTINVVTGIWVFFSINKMKSYTNIYTLATILCVALHYLLIPTIGAYAVPIDLILGEIIVSLLFYVILKRGHI